MKSFRKHRGIDLEQELRSNRPEPRPDFVAMIGGRVAGSRSRRSGVRVAVGAALTAAMLAAVAAVGGVGYASSSATKIAKTVVRISHVSHPRVVHNTSAADQYPQFAKVCYKGRVHKVKKSNLAKYLATHKGAVVVSSSARTGSRCSVRPHRKGRQHGAPAFTG